jgi:hypothetical protein
MPYRAPELFDVKTGKTLDEKVDIWVSPHHTLSCPSPLASADPVVPWLHPLRRRLRPLSI